MTSKKKPGTVAAAIIEEKRTALSRKIGRWRILQAAYMPLVAMEQQDIQVSADTPEQTALNMPSSLTSVQRDALPATHDLLRKEFRLRLAQADDALDALRRVLSLRNAVYGFKRMNLVGQRDGTRAHSLLSRLNDKKTACAQRYRAAYGALLGLNIDGTWRERLKPLLEADIKGPTGEDDDGTTKPKRTDVLGEGKKGVKITWIWTVGIDKDAVPSGGKCSSTQYVKSNL